MKTFRSIVVGVTAAGLLGLPMAASAAPVDSSGAKVQAAGRYDTAIRFLDFDHTREYGSRTVVRGQVAAPALGGSVRGVKVRLYRKYNGSSHWRYLATTRTSKTNYPKFRFTPRSRANADYRVVFGGNRDLKPSRNATGVAVYRHIRARIKDGSGRFRGRITPRYAHRLVYLDKRRCAQCGWHRVRTHHTAARGVFHFKVNAPKHGKYWWRASTPPSKRFIRSYSAVFTTRLG